MKIKKILFNSIKVDHASHQSRIIQSALPEQGSIEIQNDKPGKEHSWHIHDTDETLIILKGSILFYYEGGEKICKSGDTISLPKGTRHGSIALDEGTVYLIAMRQLDISSLQQA